MRKRKEILLQISLKEDSLKGSDDLLMKYIFYSPTMPLRHVQEQLLNEAEKSFLKADDIHIRKDLIGFNTFKWGNGRRTVLLTHGWASKAADFYELITALKNINDLQIIAFDAPGNGSSEGELTHLPLYIEAIKTVIKHYGAPDIMIGHSLGAMANIVSVQEANLHPALMISLAPVVRLKENFEASMNAVSVTDVEKDLFFKHLAKSYNVNVEKYTLENLYLAENISKHIIKYDLQDTIAPYEYLEKFLDSNPSVISCRYEEAGHDKIIKSPNVIRAIVQEILHCI